MSILFNSCATCCALVVVAFTGIKLVKPINPQQRRKS